MVVDHLVHKYDEILCSVHHGGCASNHGPPVGEGHGGASPKIQGGVLSFELELELIQTQMAQKPMLRAEVYAHTMRASQNRRKGSA